MNDFKLRNQYGETVDPTQPIPTDSTGAKQLASQSDTLTYTGKAVAGGVTISSTTYKPIISMDGSQVGSHWNNEKNKVYDAEYDGFSRSDYWLTACIKTATAATVTIYDPNTDLEKAFESLTTTVKRFVAMVTDTGGNVLYGWIYGVAKSGNAYTFDIYNHRLLQTTQSWVGNTTDFDATSLKKVEIFKYSSSLAFGTGTCLTEEVVCPREFSKSWKSQMEYAETLSNGQFFVDYMRGRIIGKRADTTVSETITYNILSNTGGGGGGGAVTIADGADVTQGAKADAKATATDTTAVSMMSVMKQISYMAQYPVNATAPSSVRFTDLDETPAQAIKATGGNLHGWNVINPNTYAVYLKFYNTAAASVTVGTTAIVKTVFIPPEGFYAEFYPEPMQTFSTAMSCACTKLLVDSDTTAILTDVYAEIFFK
jgi:hypothetical protein